MHFLPKANPLYERISADKVVIPEVLEKLGKGGFTGYLSHLAPGFESFCIFAKGKLICALSTEGNRENTGFEAITLLFDRVCSAGGEINVYRMTTDLAMCAHSLVVGKRVIKGDEVRTVDVKGLLARMKTQNLNGVVHFYTRERFAMMFYKDGQPIGFYHNNSRAIEATPDETRKIAALPGARVEVCSTKSIEELMQYDLLQVVNLAKLWDAAQARKSKTQTKETVPQAFELPTKAVVPPQQAVTPIGQSDEKLAELVEDLKEVAMAYLSREGRLLIERIMDAAGGNTVLLDSGATENILKKIEDEAKVIDSHARIDEMIDLMKSEIAGRLAV
jgi:hypothetical protein